MRVLILTDDFGGGTGNHMLQMAQVWADSDVEIEIVTSAERTARIDPPVPTHQLPPPGVLDVYPIEPLRRFREVLRHTRRFRPDVIHSYFFWSILFGRTLKALGHAKALLENREDEGFSWGLHEYSLLRLGRSLPDRVVAVSDAVREHVEDAEGLRSERVTVVHNGVPRPEPVDERTIARVRGELEIAETDLVVGMVANLNRPVKGAHHLIRAAPAILRAPGRVKILVVGGGQLLDELRREARERDLDDALLFTGYRDDVDALYELMDVAVLPSESEGLSITLLESMSRGVPVVATEVGGNPEVVVDGETGYLVPAGDAARLAGAVRSLLADPARRREMGADARRRARRAFDIEDTAASYLRLYRELGAEES